MVVVVVVDVKAEDDTTDYGVDFGASFFCPSSFWW